MKKRIALLLALLLALSGCSSNLASLADREDWDETWVGVGLYLGVEPFGYDFELMDNKDVLAANGLYYTTWVVGEPEEYVNSDGDTVDLYASQLYLLLEVCASPSDAAQEIAEWQAISEENYTVLSQTGQTVEGQTFTVLTYLCGEENPYSSGAVAFGSLGECAVSAEISCREDFGGDAGEILAAFLRCCHYFGEEAA